MVDKGKPITFTGPKAPAPIGPSDDVAKTPPASSDGPAVVPPKPETLPTPTSISPKTKAMKEKPTTPSGTDITIRTMKNDIAGEKSNPTPLHQPQNPYPSQHHHLLTPLHPP